MGQDGPYLDLLGPLLASPTLVQFPWPAKTQIRSGQDTFLTRTAFATSEKSISFFVTSQICPGWPRNHHKKRRVEILHINSVSSGARAPISARSSGSNFITLQVLWGILAYFDLHLMLEDLLSMPEGADDLMSSTVAAVKETEQVARHSSCILR